MRLLPLLVALPACLALAAPASALTPQSGTYKGSGKMSCPVEPGSKERKTCTVKATVKVSKGKLKSAAFKRSDGFTFTGVLKAGGAPVSSKGAFSSKSKGLAATYVLQGSFTSSTKLKATYQVSGADSTQTVPKFTFKANRT